VKTRVAVVQGGRSGEHEISLRSARAVTAALEAAGYDTVPYLISAEGKWSPGPLLPEPGSNPGIDVVFPILHGTFGEDGTVQGLLELADLPYVGPGVMASAVAMDKEMLKRVCAERGLPVTEYITQYRGALSVEAVEAAFAYPVFVKPANLGSSVGISKAKDRDQLTAALEFAARYDWKILIERTIVGRELECAVLGNFDSARASTPCEILPSREFYDYEDKYLLDAARTELPADLDPATTAELQRLAVAAYLACNCEGLSRVDFLMEASTGRLYLNEINTIPGFTSISMYPKMWEHSGLSMPELVHQLVQLALARHDRKKATQFTR
jgi:D-alanine-D-alanine ligase